MPSASTAPGESAANADLAATRNLITSVAVSPQRSASASPNRHTNRRSLRFASRQRLPIDTSRSRITRSRAATFHLNKEKAIKKVCKAARRSHIEVEEKKGNTVITFSAAAFQAFQSAADTYLSDCDVVKDTDCSGNYHRTVFKCIRNDVHCYTLSLFHTTLKALVNGPDLELFHKDLENILEITGLEDTETRELLDKLNRSIASLTSHVNNNRPESPSSARAHQITSPAVKEPPSHGNDPSLTKKGAVLSEPDASSIDCPPSLISVISEQTAISAAQSSTITCSDAAETTSDTSSSSLTVAAETELASPTADAVSITKPSDEIQSASLTPPTTDFVSPSMPPGAVETASPASLATDAISTSKPSEAVESASSAPPPRAVHPVATTGHNDATSRTPTVAGSADSAQSAAPTFLADVIVPSLPDLTAAEVNTSPMTELDNTAVDTMSTATACAIQHLQSDLLDMKTQLCNTMKVQELHTGTLIEAVCARLDLVQKEITSLSKTLQSLTDKIHRNNHKQKSPTPTCVVTHKSVGTNTEILSNSQPSASKIPSKTTVSGTQDHNGKSQNPLSVTTHSIHLPLRESPLKSVPQDNVLTDEDWHTSNTKSKMLPNSVKHMVLGCSLLRSLRRRGLCRKGSVHIRSFPGAKIEDVIELLNDCTSHPETETVSLLIGGNDKSQTSCLSAMYTGLFEAAHAVFPNAQIHFLSLPPQKKQYAHIDKCNSAMENLSTDIPRLRFIKIDFTNSAPYLLDGFHLNKKGTTVLAKSIIQNVLKETCENPVRPTQSYKQVAEKHFQTHSTNLSKPLSAAFRPPNDSSKVDGQVKKPLLPTPLSSAWPKPPSNEKHALHSNEEHASHSSQMSTSRYTNPNYQIQPSTWQSFTRPSNVREHQPPRRVPLSTHSIPDYHTPPTFYPMASPPSYAMTLAPMHHYEHRHEPNIMMGNADYPYAAQYPVSSPMYSSHSHHVSSPDWNHRQHPLEYVSYNRLPEY